MYRVVCDREKCRQCLRCEEHWPGVRQRFNCQGFFEIADETGMRMVWRRLEWVKNLCPRDAISIIFTRGKHG